MPDREIIHRHNRRAPIGPGWPPSPDLRGSGTTPGTAAGAAECIAAVIAPRPRTGQRHGEMAVLWLLAPVGRRRRGDRGHQRTTGGAHQRKELAGAMHTFPRSPASLPRPMAL